jgi:hypothetical protein
MEEDTVFTCKEEGNIQIQAYVYTQPVNYALINVMYTLPMTCG